MFRDYVVKLGYAILLQGLRCRNNHYRGIKI